MRATASTTSSSTTEKTSYLNEVSLCTCVQTLYSYWQSTTINNVTGGFTFRRKAMAINTLDQWTVTFHMLKNETFFTPASIQWWMKLMPVHSTHPL